LRIRSTFQVRTTEDVLVYPLLDPQSILNPVTSVILAFMNEERIASETALRDLYAPPIERARLKTLRRLDEHCRNFIALSPFVCLGTFSERGADVTPRGDEPGFIHLLDDATLAIPDWPGNNRLDSLANIVANPQVALLFLIPGVQETLRVNGSCEISTRSDLLCRWDRNGKRPKTVLVITVREAFLHCGKALIRSRLWEEDYRIERTALPSYGQMLKDHTQIDESVEQIQASIENGYRNKLY
jgi:PPOX class probable FMN-dependent enzyme